MRAVLSVRPKCSHRCVSLKESPLKPVPILKHATRRSTEQTSMRTELFKQIPIQTVQEHLLNLGEFPGRFWRLPGNSLRIRVAFQKNFLEILRKWVYEFVTCKRACNRTCKVTCKLFLGGKNTAQRHPSSTQEPRGFCYKQGLEGHPHRLWCPSLPGNSRVGAIPEFLSKSRVVVVQEWPRQTKPKKGQFMNFSQGHSGTKVQCESCLFSQGKTPEFTKMGEIHELFILALFWFGLPGRLLSGFSENSRRLWLSEIACCWKSLPRFSGSTKSYPCQGLGTFRQGERLLERRPRLRERCWIFSSETVTAFLRVLLSLGRLGLARLLRTSTQKGTLRA